ncbi:unnamed protein product [Rhizophagus irregularis]|nr:unnamed protein product [Rhizophagus irregularis]CAB5375922.1 unnamed protein product [Rhizophagus irregularis]
MTPEVVVINLFSKILLNATFLKNLTKTTVTISIENNSSYSLTNPTNYLNSGISVNSAGPIISPKCITQFVVKNGKKGMLCYKIEGSYGPNKDPYYLLISWKVKSWKSKLKRFSRSKNQFCLVLHESKELPLPRVSNKMKNFFESKHKNYKYSNDRDGFHLEGKKFRVGATMSSNDSPIIKISLEDCKSRTNKRSFIQKFRCY